MKCNVCGRPAQNEEANFCEYCGSSYREQRQNSSNMPPQNQGNPYPNGPMTYAAPLQGYGMQGAQGAPGAQRAPYAPQQIEKPTSFWSWLGTYGLLFIPLAGWLAFIVLLFIWAFSGNTPTSKKNWARATLIFSLVIVAIFIIYMIALIGSPMYQDIYQQMMNGTFDYNTYYQDMMNSYK